METAIISETFCNGVLAGLTVAVVERGAEYFLRTDAKGDTLYAKCDDEADARDQFATVIQQCRACYH